MARFSKRTGVVATPAELYRWHMRSGAFERLSPPWQDVRVVDRRGKPDVPGFRVVLSVPVGPFRRRWVAEHRDVEPEKMFRDVQIRGPFARWEHTHRFEPGSGTGAILDDEIAFEVPFGRLGRLVAGGSVAHTLERVFRYRHDTTLRDLEAHHAYRTPSPMRVLVTGANGFIGDTLHSFLSTGGHDVVPFGLLDSRVDVPPDDRTLEGLDAVIHLTGENPGDNRERIEATRALCEALARLKKQPRILVSVVGIHDSRASELVDETSDSEWEHATEPAQKAGIRVVSLRTGVVLSPRGGVLAGMVAAFGLGGLRGAGDSPVSWISIDELAMIVLHVLSTDSLDGPVDAVSQSPVTHRELTKTLAKVLGRPGVFSFPPHAKRFTPREMVTPKRLLETGYTFRYGILEGALRHLLGRSGR